MNFMPRESRAGNRRPSSRVSSSPVWIFASSPGGQVHRHVLHDREVLRCPVLPYPAVIVPEGHVQHPVQPVPIPQCERTAYANRPASRGRDEMKYRVSTVVFPPVSRVETTRPMLARPSQPGWRSRSQPMSAHWPSSRVPSGPCPRQPSGNARHFRAPAPRTTPSRPREGCPGSPSAQACSPPPGRGFSPRWRAGTPWRRS